jgi:hypothetical protein
MKSYYIIFYLISMTTIRLIQGMEENQSSTIIHISSFSFPARCSQQCSTCCTRLGTLVASCLSHNCCTDDGSRYTQGITLVAEIPETELSSTSQEVTGTNPQD